MRFVMCCGRDFQHTNVPPLPQGTPRSLEQPIPQSLAGLELGAEVAMGWGNMSLNRITTTENKRHLEDL